VFPFSIAMFIATIIVNPCPQIATWLPDAVMGKQK
jgi:TRAP-type C4-dicarboxylate transport system permease large subunit